MEGYKRYRLIATALLAGAIAFILIAVFFGTRKLGVTLRWPVALAAFFCASYSYQAWWRARAARAVSNALPHVTAGAVGEQPPRVQLGAQPPDPELTFLRAAKLPRRVGRLRRVTESGNVFGSPPLRILHLWVFDSEGRMVDYLGGTWRELGSVHLLQSLSSLGSRSRGREANRDLDAVVGDDEQEVDAAIEAFRYSPLGGGMNDVASAGMSDIQVLDRYGSYPVNTILCADAAWQYAFQRLLDIADLITMDLAGFSADHLGAGYEIGYLIDNYPMDRVVFLVDAHYDREALGRELARSWEAMAVDSPNRNVLPRIRVFETHGMYRAGTRPLVPIEARAFGIGKADARRIVRMLMTEGVLP